MAALGQALLPCPAVWIPMVMAVLLVNLGSTYLWQFHRWTLYLQQCLIHCSCASAGGNTEAFRSSGLAMNVDIDKAGGDGMVVRDQRKTLRSLSALLFIPLISSRSTSLSLPLLLSFSQTILDGLAENSLAFWTLTKSFYIRAFLKSKLNRTQQSF